MPATSAEAAASSTPSSQSGRRPRTSDATSATAPTTDMRKRYFNYQGGTAGPMMVSRPAQIESAGIWRQYTHAVHIVPTTYECLGVELPDRFKGAAQIPLEGESFAQRLHDETAKSKQTQFWSMLGTRGINHDGWKAASVTPASPDAWGDFSNTALGAVQHRDRSVRVP
jgi:arylsulfatase A-like enzyme